jgi:uncharacterized SAM-binding protein YcdF (DUF218 family)
MFFILSKTLGILTVPSNALALVALIGAILLLTRWWRAGRRILVCCLVLFLGVGLLPVGRGLAMLLEDRFPPWSPSGGTPTGIIVLGGPIKIGQSVARGAVAIGAGAERYTVLATLARRYPDSRIVISGGNPRLIGYGPPEAEFAIKLLQSFGIAQERITAEDRSRNTAENAAFTKALVHPKAGEHWLLITSAAHMPRAIGTFRQAGFPVEPYPVDYQTRAGTPLWWRGLLPSLSPIDGWRALDGISKEYAGLFAYRLTGRSSELFPGPEPR